MKTPAKILLVLAVATAAGAAFVMKNNRTPAATSADATMPAAAVIQPSSSPSVAAQLPRMVDLGAGKCIPCKMMKPILDELKRDYANQFITEFIDVWENPDAGKQYGIELIPTQIFYDAEGKELFRHTGFFGKEDILGKWKELGVDVVQDK
jgi:thioredoxin 1